MGFGRLAQRKHIFAIRPAAIHICYMLDQVVSIVLLTAKTLAITETNVWKMPIFSPIQFCSFPVGHWYRPMHCVPAALQISRRV